jgi:hypothetical protein
MECKLIEMKSYGESGGSANIAICEVLKIHVAEDIFTNGIIDPQKIDLVGRMSGNYYCRANGEAIFEVEKPTSIKGIGYDELPDFIKESDVLTANNLAKFANVENVPSEDSVKEFITKLEEKIEGFEHSEEAFYRYQRLSNYKYMMKAAIKFVNENHPKAKYFTELSAKCALENNDTDYAWKVILTLEYIGN